MVRDRIIRVQIAFHEAIAWLLRWLWLHSQARIDFLRHRLAVLERSNLRPRLK
jgi:hypothetical protein